MKNFEETAAMLRIAFDRSFATAPPEPIGEQLDFLVVRIAGEAYAVALASVLALHVDRKIVSVPSTVPSLRGLVALRGVLTPAYDLATLLGYPTIDKPRWLMLTHGAADTDPVALAFEAFERHLRVPVVAVQLASSGEHARPYIGGGVSDMPIIDIASVCRALTTSKET